MALHDPELLKLERELRDLKKQKESVQSGAAVTAEVAFIEQQIRDIQEKIRRKKGYGSDV